MTRSNYWRCLMNLFAINNGKTTDDWRFRCDCRNLTKQDITKVIVSLLLCFFYFYYSSPSTCSLFLHPSACFHISWSLWLLFAARATRSWLRSNPVPGCKILLNQKNTSEEIVVLSETLETKEGFAKPFSSSRDIKSATMSKARSFPARRDWSCQVCEAPQCVHHIWWVLRAWSRSMTLL